MKPKLCPLASLSSFLKALRAVTVIFPQVPQVRTPMYTVCAPMPAVIK